MLIMQERALYSKSNQNNLSHFMPHDLTEHDYQVLPIIKKAICNLK
jgi:hypothetical protein